MRVLKFGGTSVANADRIREASNIVEAAFDQDRLIVVVSALAGVTNGLIELVKAVLSGDRRWRHGFDALCKRHHSELSVIGSGEHAEETAAVDACIHELGCLLAGIGLIGECPDGTRDRILASGERLSAQLMVAALRKRGLQTLVVDGSELIVAERTREGAVVDAGATAIRSAKRLSAVNRNVVPVVTGFVASDPAGRTVTLGRGGSDLTATVLGAALDCDRVEIWTDVDGVMTAPPKAVRAAQTLPVLSVAEAAQLAFFGAKVLHPTCLAVLEDRDIPVLIRNTHNPEGSFTAVRREIAEQAGIRAVAAVENVEVFEIRRPPGADRDWSQRFDRALAAIQGRLLAASRASADGTWALVAPAGFGGTVADRLAASRVDGSLERHGGSLLALVGSSVLAQPWVVGRALEALGRRSVTVNGLFAGSTPCAVSVLVNPEELDTALEIVHEALMLGSRAEAAPNPWEVEYGKKKTESRCSRSNRQCRPETHSPAA